MTIVAAPTIPKSAGEIKRAKIPTTISLRIFWMILPEDAQKKP